MFDTYTIQEIEIPTPVEIARAVTHVALAASWMGLFVFFLAVDGWRAFL